MAGNEKKRKIILAVWIVLTIAVFVVSLFKNDSYNKQSHSDSYLVTKLIEKGANGETDESGVSVSIAIRSDSWTKLLDINNEGLEENNYQAYTCDFNIINKTKDVVSDFTFKMDFVKEAFIASAWNGSVEIHQFRDGAEIVSNISDLRVYDPADYDCETFTSQGEVFIRMRSGDFVIYHPSEAITAMEVPIKSGEGTTPGFIIYAPIGEEPGDVGFVIDYKLHRKLQNEPLFIVSIVMLAIFVIMLIIYFIVSVQIRKYNERHERDNQIINEAIETFTGFIDAKDPYTNGHSNRVAEYSRLIAEKMGYEGEELDRIYYVALLHDCGKIGVPDNVLKKPGKLTDEEFGVIKSHTVRGGEILAKFKTLKDVGEGALYHHEKFDGSGYPEGKSGEDIPLIARIICVADSFDAMNSNRVYRKKLTKEYIINEIEQNKGKQFDPEIADIMLGLIKDGTVKMDD